MGTLSDSVKGSARAGTTWGFAVMIAGMRAGWLAMAVVLGVYMVLMLRRENRELRRTVFTIPVLVIIVILYLLLMASLKIWPVW